MMTRNDAQTTSSGVFVGFLFLKLCYTLFLFVARSLSPLPLHEATPPSRTIVTVNRQMPRQLVLLVVRRRHHRPIKQQDHQVARDQVQLVHIQHLH